MEWLRNQGFEHKLVRLVECGHDLIVEPFALAVERVEGPEQIDDGVFIVDHPEGGPRIGTRRLRRRHGGGRHSGGNERSNHPRSSPIRAEEWGRIDHTDARKLSRALGAPVSPPARYGASVVPVHHGPPARYPEMMVTN